MAPYDIYVTLCYLFVTLSCVGSFVLPNNKSFNFSREVFVVG